MKREYKGTDTNFGSPYFQPTLTTKCGHHINFEQVAQFSRDKCESCGEWIHRDELVKNRIIQIELILEEIAKLT